MVVIKKDLKVIFSALFLIKVSFVNYIENSFLFPLTFNDIKLKKKNNTKTELE